MVRARVRLLLLLAAAVAACESVQSAPVPREGDCITDVRAGGPVSDPEGRVLDGYEVTECDAPEAEYRVADVIAPVGHREPTRCPARFIEARITLSSEPALTTWNICLERIKRP